MLSRVFKTSELRPFRAGLPEADSPAALVEATLEYLLDQRMRGGLPVLPEFLSELRNQYETGDGLREELDALYGAVKSHLAETNIHLDHELQDEKLFDLLLRLDFADQVRIARKVIELHRVAAFLVHGEPECGQRLLLTRLVRLNPGWPNAQRVTIDVGSSGIGKRSRSLWRQVAYKMGLPPTSSPNEIAQAVCESMKLNDVIIILQSVDYMLPELLTEWMDEFWVPLANIVRDQLGDAQTGTRLLLYLVDYVGGVCDWNVPLDRSYEPSTYSGIPIQLPAVGRFSPMILQSWLDEADMIPYGLNTEVILNTSDNGRPELVYEKVCVHCGVNWEGDLAQWLL